MAAQRQASSASQTPHISPAELSYLYTSLALPGSPIRPDGRSATQFRPLTAETDILPGTNGSARVGFADGTQAIVGVKAEVEKTVVSADALKLPQQTQEEYVGNNDGEANQGSSSGHGSWVQMSIEIPGFRDDDALPVFLSEMMREPLVESVSSEGSGNGEMTGGLKGRLVINKRWHWRLYIDVLLLSQPQSYPLPLLSLTTHLALLSTKLPKLKSKGEEDPFFDDDWDAAEYLYPRSTSTASATPSQQVRPPVTLLVVSVGENIIFDPDREEIAVADTVLAVSITRDSDSDSLKLVSIRTIDPPSRLTQPGVPNSENVTTLGSTAAAEEAAILNPSTGEEEVPGVWRPRRGFTTLVASIFLFFILRSFALRQTGGDGCGVPVMSPTFIRMVGFDTEHTRFASKYNLYLYREGGVDPYSQENLGLNGVPVLFLPGNAGSYRQVRSLAAEASRHYYDVVRHDEDRLNAGTRSLDFFMIDFNEDMAAFHGQTLLDQAEYVNEAVAYILSLYHDPRRSRRDPELPDPSAVVLVGHSMGGIVARTALTMTNYQANSVNTIVTMSAPHAKPPVSFDSDIVQTYKQINDYWREAYSQTWANDNPLWHVTLISIAGGSRDTVVPSDYASISSLVPETHGFTVFTSTIPDVWIGMDHLSITWCDQFRKAIIKSLFEVVDVRRATQTKPRAERMRIFKKWYLTGMETVAERTLPRKEPNTLLTLEDQSNTILSQGKRLILRDLGHRRGPNVHLLPIPPQGVSGKKFTLLTNQQFDKSGDHGSLEVLFCSVFPLQNGKPATAFSMNMDFSGGTSGSTRLACKNAAEDGIHLPASTPSSKRPYDRVQPFSYLQYDLEDLAEHQFVAVVDKANSPTKGFVLAEFSDSSDSVIRARLGLGSLLSAGLKVRLPANRPMLTELQIPAVHSSLLDYRLKIIRKNHGQQQELFAPLLRQSVADPHESKFFVNVKNVNVNLHGLAPFMPPPLREQATLGGVSFHLWTDPSCDSTIDISLSVDIAGSLGELVMRYRTVFAAFPLLVVALVMRKQFQVYDETGYFITFAEGLDSALRSSLPMLLLAMSLLASSLATSTKLPPTDDPFHWRTNSTESPIDFTKNDLLLGSQDAFFWFLVPIFGLISVGVCLVINYVALALIFLLTSIYGFLRSKSGYIRRDEKGNLPIFSSASPRRRLVNSAILLALVSTVIPYQFAYMVACIVQLATSVRASWHAKEAKSTTHYNFANFAYSIFLLMLWILPINALVLLVWAHNLVVHWFMPFSSHHNVLSIMPFVLLVEAMTTGTMIPRVTTRFKHVTSMLFFFIAIYSAIYGVSYAYLLHHLTNILAAWLVGIYFSASGFSLSRLWRVLEGDEAVQNPASGSHTKKKP